jgi:hypothetical protein
MSRDVVIKAVTLGIGLVVIVSVLSFFVAGITGPFAIGMKVLIAVMTIAAGWGVFAWLVTIFYLPKRYGVSVGEFLFTVPEQPAIARDRKYWRNQFLVSWVVVVCCLGVWAMLVL